MFINERFVPNRNTCCLISSMALDAKLRWKLQVKKKITRTRCEIEEAVLVDWKELSSQYSISSCFINKSLSLYRLMLFNCGVVSNHVTERKIIQRFHNKVQYFVALLVCPSTFTMIIYNRILKKKLSMSLRILLSHEKRLHQQVTVEVLQLLETDSLTRRLRRTKQFKLV